MRNSSLLLAVGAASLFGLLGCTDLDDSTNDTSDTSDTSVRSLGPLTAPRNAAFGQVGIGSSSLLGLELDNGGRSEVTIRQVTMYPPDPFDPAFVPPDPCIPPDPYHNPLENFTPRLLAPCVKPAGTTTLFVAFASPTAGGFAAGIRVDYATGDGGAYTLTIPATACVTARAPLTR